MDIKEYQGFVKELSIYPSTLAIIYPTLGLTGEAGEVSEKVKKLYRDESGVVSRVFVDGVKKELGDVLFYITAIANDLDLTLQEVFDCNVEKLTARRERNTLKGNGDDR